MNVPIHLIFILLSAIVGFIVLLKGALPSYLKFFPLFLICTFIVEVIGWQLGVRGINNVIYFNFSSIISIIYFLYIIHELLISRIAMRIIIICAIVYTIVALTNIFFIHGMHVFHTMTWSVGSFLIIIFCVYFFYELFTRPYFINLRREPGFWIVTGLLFFNACALPFSGLANYIYQFSPVLIRSFYWMLSFLNVLLYLLFTIAFLCRINFQRSMS